MRALLLAGVGIVAFGGAAMAEGDRGNHHRRYQPAIMDHYAAALGVNIGEVRGNSSTTGRGQAVGVTTTGSFGGARGVMNVNQNAGANSAQQNAVAIAYIEGCDCRVEFKYGDGNANAVAGNGGQVVGNNSANGEYSRRHHHGDDGTSASATLAGSFGSATGIAQVNQNAGANSLQQNATAVAYIDNVSGTRRQDRDAWAIAGNAGRVTGSGNSSDDYRHRANGSIEGAFAGFTGVANVNQNVGANSLQQNAAALSAVEYCNCATRDLSTVVAAAANLGSVSYNRADADRGAAFATIGGSFNGITGITQVNQNAGANSLMQNSVAVGAVYNR
ncbi:hypothetical protein J5Y09_07780 [Roseomonas sp. PWR1]|uniref:Adhesin n=1 Tax=Roseomonas nitratireducens TaxID=2820810 RepID=A0ABS4AR34_9PROT|nr:hypothetical protein [Neoroseomonas nitratireducens]MBP0463806.1 hypothetical protein [Neoroseomonas nitratireducens]